MLTQLRLENFKSWKDTRDIPLKPITGFFGPNSSGKSSLLQALLLMKQTAESPDRGIVLHFGDETTPVDLGDFRSVIYAHETERPLSFSVGWNSGLKFEIPPQYGGGTVSVGDSLRFEVEAGEESIRSRKLLMVNEMSYQLADGRQFGLQRLPNRKGYTLLIHGSMIEDPNRTSVGTNFPPSKFYDFSYWTRHPLEDGGFLLDLQYGLESLLEDLHYLGPLRVHPNRIYPRSGAQPLDVGSTGESLVDAILSSRERRERISLNPGSTTIERYVSEWLRRLGLAHDFRVTALSKGRRWFEVKLRKSPDSPEVLLTDMGFGVSQILPVLVLCFYVPRESTVILEQPDIHLHPSAQASLADVFIDAWEKRGVQILFESHSEHLLRRLQLRIAKGEINADDVGLFFCSMEEDGGSGLRHLELDQSGNIVNWPKDFFGDQFGEIAAMSEAALRRLAASE